MGFRAARALKMFGSHVRTLAGDSSASPILLELFQRYAGHLRVEHCNQITTSTNIMTAKKKNGVAVDFAASTGKDRRDHGIHDPERRGPSA